VNPERDSISDRRIVTAQIEEHHAACRGPLPFRHNELEFSATRKSALGQKRTLACKRFCSDRRRAWALCLYEIGAIGNPSSSEPVQGETRVAEPQMNLQGSVIVITGAAQGLGQRTAEIVAGQGAKIALVDLDHSKLQNTLQLCVAAGAMVRDYPVDVTDEPAVEALFNSVQREFGSVDGLINNAGITSDALLVKAVDGKVQSKMSLAEFHKVIAVDLRGVFLCAREAAARMIEGGHGGVIVNISSVSRAGNVGQTNYAAAKAGVAAMTVTWAKELARHKIRVAAIAPGFSNTRMVASIPPKVKDKLVSTIPLRRLAEPEEIGRAALFILQNDYYDGRVLEIDGGLRL
jgi:3-oxoacyl-[acyl-carrier protein] reductase